MAPPDRVRLPHLRRKGKAWYFDTQRKPRYWIPLGSNWPLALRRYQELIAQPQSAGTVGRMVQEHVNALRGQVADGTHREYRVWNRHLSGVFGHLRPHEVTQADILLYLDRCPRTSARGEISLLSGAYRRAMRGGGVTFNPCIGARSDKPRSQRDRLLSDDELLAIRDKASPLLQVAIDLSHLTSLRISDLCTLRWDAFAPGGHVRTAKTGARARYRLTDDLRTVLDAARALQGNVVTLWVFSNRGRQLNRHTVGVWWRAACKAAGIKDAQWRDIRAKSGTDADAQGQDAQALLGHTSARTTAIYLRGKQIKEVEPLRRRK